MRLPLEQTIGLLIKEAFHYKRTFVGIFVLLCIATLVGSKFLQKAYTASTTIFVDEKNIIRPLMEGAAVPTGVTDRAKIARTVIFGRKIMDRILEHAGWLSEDLSPAKQERIISRLIASTKISNAGQNLIKIEYKDSDAERSFKTTEKFAELFISESFRTKAAESQAAFEFIDNQTNLYHKKLKKAEDDLKEFRSANLDAQAGTAGGISAKLNEIQRRLEEARLKLREAEIKKVSLEKQLSGEAEIASVISHEDQYRVRIAQLQSQMEDLRLRFHDTHPDIVQIRHQINDLNEAILTEVRRREAAKAGNGVSIVDERFKFTPLYEQLRSELSKTKTIIDTLSARIASSKKQLAQEFERGRRVHIGEATLAELTRDYEVIHNIYQDLLKRRETARVSMSLDQEQKGLAFKIHEPATLPRQPSGIQFSHFVMGGFLLSVLIPIGLLILLVEFDPRIKVGSVISEKLKLPVLAVVPHLRSPSEALALRREYWWLAGIVVSTLIAFTAYVYMYIQNNLVT